MTFLCWFCSVNSRYVNYYSVLVFEEHSQEERDVLSLAVVLCVHSVRWKY